MVAVSCFVVVNPYMLFAHENNDMYAVLNARKHGTNTTRHPP